MRNMSSFDPIWEEKYAQGHAQRYPWDTVVSFVFRFCPRDKPRQETRILEVGCGTGANLWFAAREGFQVAGVDASPSAIAYGRKRFEAEGIQGDLRKGDFTQLPFEKDAFDLVIDRASLTCCGFSAAQAAIAEIRRVMQQGGKLLFNPYSDRHSSYLSGRLGADGLVLDISEGTLIGAGQICFYGRSHLASLLDRGWKILSVDHVERVQMLVPQYTIHAEWRIVAEKVEEEESGEIGKRT
jgi:SAM-dependent methyltransferase